MTPAQEVLHLRQCERVAWKTADKWAGADEIAQPWWRRNLYLYQNQALSFADRRIALLRSYLTERAGRSKCSRGTTGQTS